MENLLVSGGIIVITAIIRAIGLLFVKNYLTGPEQVEETHRKPPVIEREQIREPPKSIEPRICFVDYKSDYRDY